MFFVLCGVAAFGLVALAMVFAMYFHTFNGELTVEHDKWAMFGDFVGGTLNPILAFLSLMALLFTIFFQSKELNISNQTLKETQAELKQAREIAAEQAQHSRKESDKGDLIRALDAVHYEIKDLFEKSVDFCPDKNNMAWFFSNSAPGVSENVIPKNGDAVSQNDRIQLADVSEYILELSGYLDEYIAKFGSSAVSFYYQRRYLTAKNRLVSKGFLIEQVLTGFHSPGYGWSASALTKPSN